MTGIYYITNKVENKKYIGCSRNIEKRFSEHRKMLNEGSHHSYKLQKAWNKYKEDDFIFETVEECEVNDLFVIEAKHIFKENSIKEGYNVAEPNVFIDADGNIKSLDVLYNKDLICKPNSLIWMDKTKYTRLQYDFLNLILQTIYRNPKEKEFIISIEDFKTISKQSINKKYFLEIGREIEKLSEFEELKPIIESIKIDRCLRNYNVILSKEFDFSIFKTNYTLIDLSVCKKLRNSELFVYELSMSYKSLVKKLKQVKIKYSKEELKGFLGINVGDYDKLNIFKSRVLNPIEAKLKEFGIIVKFIAVGRGVWNDGFTVNLSEEEQDMI